MNWQEGCLTIEMYSHKYRYDIENFFKNAGLANKSGHTPNQIKTIEGEIKSKGKKCIICYMSIPDRLTLNDFLQYKDQLQYKHNCTVDIEYIEGYVKIEFTER